MRSRASSFEPARLHAKSKRSRCNSRDPSSSKSCSRDEAPSALTLNQGYHLLAGLWVFASKGEFGVAGSVTFGSHGSFGVARPYAFIVRRRLARGGRGLSPRTARSASA